MTEIKLQKLVDQAVELDCQVQKQIADLKWLKEQLAFEAGTRADEQVKTDGGGWSVALAGTSGQIARVTQPGPKLKATINAEKGAGAKLIKLLGKFKDHLFTPVLVYAPVENFRERVKEFFAPATAKAIIMACESASAVQVAFETKEIA